MVSLSVQVTVRRGVPSSTRLRALSYRDRLLTWVRARLRSRSLRRADRVWTIVALAGAESGFTFRDSAVHALGSGLVSSAAYEQLSRASAEDWALANAMLNVERRIRDTEIAAVERMLDEPTFDPEAPDALQDALRRLPDMRLGFTVFGPAADPFADAGRG